MELSAAARDPVTDALARRAIARQRHLVAVTVCAFERDPAARLGHRGHRQAAPLALARRVLQEFTQVPADLPMNDASRSALRYTRHDRRGCWPRRLFAPGHGPAASPGKGKSATECDHTSSCI